MSKPSRKSVGKAIDKTNVKAQVADVALVHQRREQIVEAAVELFANQGFYRTTVQEVAKLAGMSTGSIYYYARTKEDVLLLALLSVLDSYKREIPKALEGVVDPLARLTAAVGAYARVIDERRSATLLAYRSTKALPPRQRAMIMDAERETNRMISDCLEDCVTHGLVRDVNLDIATTLFVMMAHSWALKHWRLKDAVSLDEFIDGCFDIVFNGMLTKLGARKFAAAKKAALAAPSSVENVLAPSSKKGGKRTRPAASPTSPVRPERGKIRAGQPGP